MLGAPCSPCCVKCGDAYPYGDPDGRGTWTPSGSWITGVTWSFGGESSNTFYFYGSNGTSGGGSTTAFDNLCNWYVAKNTNNVDTFSLSGTTTRAKRLPGEEDVVFVYSNMNALYESGSGASVKTAYFFGNIRLSGVLSTTTPVLDSVGGAVFSGFSSNFFGTVNNGATFHGRAMNDRGTVNNGALFTGAIGGAENFGTVNGGASFTGVSRNFGVGTVNGGATFAATSRNWTGTVNGNATFGESSQNEDGVVNGNATFNDSARCQGGTVTGSAVFNASSRNTGNVNGGATFNSTSSNAGTVSSGAVFNGSSSNSGTINGGAVFNNNSRNTSGLVSGSATFNDGACSTFFTRISGVFRFTASLGDLPTCNGSAPTFEARGSATCGCG